MADATSLPSNKSSLIDMEITTTCTPPNIQLMQEAEVATDSLCKATCETAKPNNSRKRRVRFAPPVQFEYTYPEDQDKRELWWNRSDFESIMSKAMNTASEARHHPMVSAGLTQAFQLAVRMTSLLGSECNLAEHLTKIQEEHRGLKLWCQYGHARRGLEKFTSRQYNDVRKKQLYKHCKRVTSLSKQGADPEEIRHVSERTSRLSAIFARMLAIADAQAVAENSLLQGPNVPMPQQRSPEIVLSKSLQMPSPLISVKRISPVSRARMDSLSQR